MAFRNVLSDPLSISTKGSFTGYFREPQSTECSSTCGTPVSSRGSVRQLKEKTWKQICHMSLA